tara:strand:+ start:735 stop:1115 length:381 start_codon:yes stop_codon:yes gene_type:complete
MAAERPTTELTEVKRTSLNQGQGKKIQILEVEWVRATSQAANDWIVLNSLDGVDSVLAILSFQAWDGGSSEVTTGATDWTYAFSRRAATGTTNAPTAGEDRLTMLRGHSGGLGYDGAMITLLIEST